MVLGNGKVGVAIGVPGVYTQIFAIDVRTLVKDIRAEIAESKLELEAQIPQMQPTVDPDDQCHP